MDRAAPGAAAPTGEAWDPGASTTAACVAVPLRVGDGVRGALVAQWDSGRMFAGHEADMLQTVANVVATVLEREAASGLQLQAERALRLAALGQVAAGVAHEVFNALASIQVTVQAVASDPAAGPAARRAARAVNSEAERANGFVEELLEFARLKAVVPQPVELGRWLGERAETWSTDLPGSVTLRLEADSPGPVVDADRLRLERAVGNLVRNAGEAMGGAGEVLVRLSRQEVPYAAAPPSPGITPGPWARIDVCDSGPGINEELLARIFEPFFTTKANVAGAGLGLAQAHGVVLQHGGHITVASTPGVGTVVSVWLRSRG